MTSDMKKLLIIGVWIWMGILTGCHYYGPCLDGNGPSVGEIRSTGSFTGITNTGSFNVHVSRSDEFSVEVVAQENLLPVIETYVSGYTLIIQTKDGTCFRSDSPVEVYVTLPELEVLKLSGSGKVIADLAESQVFECSNSGSGSVRIDTVYASNVVIGNSGSGSVNLWESHASKLNLVQSGSGTIDAGTVYESRDVSIRHSSSGRVKATLADGILLNAIMSGSGRIELAGDATMADYTLNSSGRIDALELVAEDVEATNTGSGNIFLWATELLHATITGSGNIIYRGQPTLNFQITGSGSLRPY